VAAAVETNFMSWLNYVRYDTSSTYRT
jgi:hypothetical protein